MPGPPALEALMKRLSSIGYDESELVKGVKRLTGSHVTTPEQYRELSQFAGQRLALGIESFESAKNVLRALHAYFVQFENPSISPAMAENTTKALLKAILAHILIQEKKDIVKAAFNDLAKALESKLVSASNESRVVVRDLVSLVKSFTPSFFGGSEAEVVELMPFPIREAIKTIIEGLGPIRISATVTVNPDDIFVSQAGMVREGVTFPKVKDGNLVKHSIGGAKVPRVAFAGPAKLLYDSFSISRLLNTTPSGETLGSARGFSLPAAAAEAALQQKKRTRVLKTALNPMSSYAERFLLKRKNVKGNSGTPAPASPRPPVPSLENMRPAASTRKRGRLSPINEDEENSQSRRRKTAAGVGLNLGGNSKSKSKSQRRTRRA
jgi:hypothetical protein